MVPVGVMLWVLLVVPAEGGVSQDFPVCCHPKLVSDGARGAVVSVWGLGDLLCLSVSLALSGCHLASEHRLSSASLCSVLPAEITTRVCHTVEGKLSLFSLEKPL